MLLPYSASGSFLPVSEADSKSGTPLTTQNCLKSLPKKFQRPAQDGPQVTFLTFLLSLVLIL